MALDKILVIGKDDGIHEILRPHCQQLFAADENDNKWEVISTVNPGLIIFNANNEQQKTSEFLSDIQDKAIDIPVVLISTLNNINNSDQLIAMGAAACLSGQNEISKLPAVIESIDTGTDKENFQQYFDDQCPHSVSIVGRSLATCNTLKMIRLVAQSNCNPVLITGETGTGKELAARAVHILRHGSDSRFVAINCAALTANLLESELFGHVKGSFTGADRDKTGLLELASDGTIFLDEISEMPVNLQAKLLRVIQERKFRKVGGSAETSTSATIIASSNMNLLKAVKTGKFRSDLYYRLAICPISLMPLRNHNRKEDITTLAEYFVKTSNICPEKTGKIRGFTKMAMQALQSHNWPGNVRELRNVIERAILLETTDKIGLSNLFLEDTDCENHGQYSQRSGAIKDFSLEKAEKELIGKALKEAGWQKTRAAAMLGITRATLYAKVKQYDIKEPSKEMASA